MDVQRSSGGPGITGDSRVVYGQRLRRRRRLRLLPIFDLVGLDLLLYPAQTEFLHPSYHALSCVCNRSWKKVRPVMQPCSRYRQMQFNEHTPKEFTNHSINFSWLPRADRTSAGTSSTSDIFRIWVGVPVLTAGCAAVPWQLLVDEVVKRAERATSVGARHLSAC